MYVVHEHGHGRKTSRGWELSLPGNEWRATSEHVRKASALIVAEQCPHHAVIVHKHTGATVFDNGKPPRNRTDWN